MIVTWNLGSEVWLFCIVEILGLIEDVDLNYNDFVWKSIVTLLCSSLSPSSLLSPASPWLPWSISPAPISSSFSPLPQSSCRQWLNVAQHYNIQTVVIKWQTPPPQFHHVLKQAKVRPCLAFQWTALWWFLTCCAVTIFTELTWLSDHVKVLN